MFGLQGVRHRRTVKNDFENSHAGEGPQSDRRSAKHLYFPMRQLQVSGDKESGVANGLPRPRLGMRYS